MKIKKLTMFLILSSLVFGNDIELENLEKLKEKNLITREDYLILKNEILGANEEIQYTLKVNGIEKDNFYPVIVKNDDIYLNLNVFFEKIGISNYYDKNSNKIKVILGENLRKIEINLNEKTIIENGKKVEIDTNSLIIKDNEIYMSKALFKKLFTYDLRIDEEISLLSIYLNFSPPDEVGRRLDLKAEALENQKKEGNLYYESERKMFELGYVRVQANKIWRKEEGKSGYKNTWDGSLDYQGGLLYGQLQAKYDMKENDLKNIRLEYNEIWKEHTLQIENNSVGNKNRAWGFNFFKDKSYYTEGKNVIIKESVPIGSRVELRYMGSSISIKNEENGAVIFDNPIIKSDRTYTLVVYTANGEIFEKTIRTVKDFDLQNKGDVQYNINFREDYLTKKYSSTIETFYGISNKLTLGAGYARNIENSNEKSRYTEDGTANIIYGDTINGFSYVTRFNFEKSLDDYKENDKNYKDKYKYGGLVQLSYDKWRYTYESNKLGKFYDDKKDIKHELQYDINRNIRLNYDYSKIYKYKGKDKKDSNYGLSIDKTIGKVLFSAEYNKAVYGEDSYSLSAYYTTRNNVSLRLENKWENSGKDYETLLSIYNNNFKGFIDYNVEFGYSPEYKDRITFGFTIRLADWFEVSSDFDKKGNREHKVGIDKIVDLRNPSVKIDSMDNSRVKVVTFVDENNNNIWDKGEERIEGVEVTLGGQSIITNRNGEGMFYGVSNGIIHNLKPTIKKPAFTLGENKINVRGTFASTIEAYIPIKPMLNLTGEIIIDEKMGLSDLEKEALYQDLLIEIKDMNGESIELAIPDNTGIFDISGLYPDKYTVDVTYLGVKYDLNKVSEILKLDYQKDSFENKVAFKLSNEKIEKLN